MSLIEIHGLTKLFGSVRAVEDLSFEIEAGTIAAGRFGVIRRRDVT